MRGAEVLPEPSSSEAEQLPEHIAAGSDGAEELLELKAESSCR